MSYLEYCSHILNEEFPGQFEIKRMSLSPVGPFQIWIIPTKSEAPSLMFETDSNFCWDDMDVERKLIFENGRTVSLGWQWPYSLVETVRGLFSSNLVLLRRPFSRKFWLDFDPPLSTRWAPQGSCFKFCPRQTIVFDFGSWSI